MIYPVFLLLCVDLTNTLHAARPHCCACATNAFHLCGFYYTSSSFSKVSLMILHVCMFVLIIIIINLIFWYIFAAFLHFK